MVRTNRIITATKCETCFIRGPLIFQRFPDEITRYCPALFSLCRACGTAIWISDSWISKSPQAAQSEKAQSEKAPDTVISLSFADAAGKLKSSVDVRHATLYSHPFTTGDAIAAGTPAERAAAGGAD
jgi:hypothetical protein